MNYSIETAFISVGDIIKYIAIMQCESLKRLALIDVTVSKPLNTSSLNLFHFTPWFAMMDSDVSYTAPLRKHVQDFLVNDLQYPAVCRGLVTMAKK